MKLHARACHRMRIDVPFHLEIVPKYSIITLTRRPRASQVLIELILGRSPMVCSVYLRYPKNDRDHHERIAREAARKDSSCSACKPVQALDTETGLFAGSSQTCRVDQTKTQNV